MNPETPDDSISAPSRVSIETTPSTLISGLQETPAEGLQTSIPEEFPNAPQSIAPAPETTSETPLPENLQLALAFSPAPSAPFQSSVTVGLSCNTPNARIYYSTGGVDVGEDGVLFESKDPILLTQSTTLAARAFKNGERGPLLRARFEVNKALWQENEPADASDAVPHKISGNMTAPDAWNLGAASVRGKLHAHRALWREDSFALGNIETSGGVWSVIIVSDGAGSAPLSRVGSRVACDGALQSLRESLGQIESLGADKSALESDDLPKLRAALIQSASAALEALRLEAQTRAKPLNAFAATLLILVRREWNGAQLCGALQVGDGAIALDCQSGLKLLGVADHGQHSSETRFLTTNGIETEFAARTKFSYPPDLKATLIISDGVSDDYFPEDKRLGEVFSAVLPLVQNAPDAGKSVLDWLGYEKKGSSDDRTLVVSWPDFTTVETNASPNLETIVESTKNEAELPKKLIVETKIDESTKNEVNYSKNTIEEANNIANPTKNEVVSQSNSDSTTVEAIDLENIKSSLENDADPTKNQAMNSEPRDGS